MKRPTGEGKPKLKTYAKPRLTEYGQVEKLTQGGGGTKIDGVHTKRR
jgi:hypothetical protein